MDSLAKLNAVRWDLDGDGAPVPSATSAFAAAFPNPRGGSVCPTTVSGVSCRGYELTTDLDFDTDGDGDVDVDDDYPNWTPIPTNSTLAGFEATLRGNGHVVDKLTVRRSNNPADSVATRSRAGLFGVVGASGRVESLGVVNASVQAPRRALCRRRRGRVAGAESSPAIPPGASRRWIWPEVLSERRVPRPRRTRRASSPAIRRRRFPRRAGVPTSPETRRDWWGATTTARSWRATPPVGFRRVRASSTRGPRPATACRAESPRPPSGSGVVRDSYWDTLATGQTTTYATQPGRRRGRRHRHGRRHHGRRLDHRATPIAHRLRRRLRGLGRGLGRRRRSGRSVGLRQFERVPVAEVGRVRRDEAVRGDGAARGNVRILGNGAGQDVRGGAPDRAVPGSGGGRRRGFDALRGARPAGGHVVRRGRFGAMRPAALGVRDAGGARLARGDGDGAGRFGRSRDAVVRFAGGRGRGSGIGPGGGVVGSGAAVGGCGGAGPADGFADGGRPAVVDEPERGGERGGEPGGASGWRRTWRNWICGGTR